MEPENGPLKEGIPIKNQSFSGLYLKLWGCISIPKTYKGRKSHPPSVGFPGTARQPQNPEEDASDDKCQDL